MPPAYLRGPDVAVSPAPFVGGCTGKIAQTRREALGAKRRRAMFSAKAGGAYRCATCGWWHTSHVGDALPMGTKLDARRAAVVVGLIR